jgi:Raf kinase inhibitor-like YbhB/YbcL family protein
MLTAIRRLFSSGSGTWLGVALVAGFSLLAMNHALSGGDRMSIEVTSKAFPRNGSMPGKYSCDGENVSPPLTFSGIPEQAQSLALIMEDPDAPGGVFTHWVLWNLPPDIGGLPEDYQASGAVQSGSNSFGKTGYGGPCPPDGTHRYFFKVYALDTTLDLDSGADKDAVLGAMSNHGLTEGQLMGTYTR